MQLGRIGRSNNWINLTRRERRDRLIFRALWLMMIILLLRLLRLLLLMLLLQLALWHIVLKTICLILLHPFNLHKSLLRASILILILACFLIIVSHRWGSGNYVRIWWGWTRWSILTDLILLYYLSLTKMNDFIFFLLLTKVRSIFFGVVMARLLKELYLLLFTILIHLALKF